MAKKSKTEKRPSGLKTHILMVLDESGSMGTKRHDVINGHNRFVTDQKDSGEDCSMSLVKFNTEKSRVYTSKPIGDVPHLDDDLYVPGGNTALYDAVAEAIRIGDQEKCDRVVCVVVTDGEENSSRETTMGQLTDLMKEREARGNWTFVYLGVEPSRWAATTGMSASNTRSYNPDTLVGDFHATSVGTVSLMSSTVGSTRDFYGDVDASDAAKTIGSRGGKKGGPARAAKLSADERSKIAKKAADARWFNTRPEED